MGEPASESAEVSQDPVVGSSGALSRDEAHRCFRRNGVRVCGVRDVETAWDAARKYCRMVGGDGAVTLAGEGVFLTPAGDRYWVFDADLGEAAQTTRGWRSATLVVSVRFGTCWYVAAERRP